MIIYTKTEFATLTECFLEARMLYEGLAAMVPGFETLPRDRDGTVTLNKNHDGSLDSIVLESGPIGKST